MKRFWRERKLPLPTQKILPHITHGVVEGVAGIAGREAEFAAGFGVIEVPEIFRHFDRVGFNRRSKLPLPKQRVDHLRARDRKL